MNFYLKKYGFLTAQLNEPVHPDTQIIVVIPCFNEPDLKRTLKSLVECTPTKCKVEVIVVVNAGLHHEETIRARNKKTLEEFHAFVELHNSALTFHCIYIDDLPKKHAGVGLARKIGMDEAVARFDKVGVDGIIVCFDADAQVAPNYLEEIEKHFIDNPKSPGCSIHFEHPTSGDMYNAAVYEGIINYELHLRYYNQALKFAQLPYAFHTVGSSMAVRSSAYQKQGGMNKRKAGEDFYFIHKIIALGNFTELKRTKVIPSPRESDRVPFGTGKAISDWISTGQKAYQTYNLKSFQLIKSFISQTDVLFSGETPFISEAFNQYLSEQSFETRLAEIRKNTTDYDSFLKRFFVWFDAFQVLKLVHYLRDTELPNQDLTREACQLLSLIDNSKSEVKSNLLLLNEYRILEKK